MDICCVDGVSALEETLRITGRIPHADVPRPEVIIANTGCSDKVPVWTTLASIRYQIYHYARGLDQSLSLGHSASACAERHQP
jgi:hypothetical protein